MKNKTQKRLVAISMAVIMTAALTIVGCTTPAPPPAPAPSPVPTPVTAPIPSPTPTPVKYEWPRTFFIAAVGTPGTAKHVSWGSVLESSTGMAVRVVTEATNMAVLMNLKAKKMQYGSIDHTEVANNMEANEDHAVRDGGPWPVRIVWAHDLGFTGFMLRGDSPITYPWDIKPGVRIAVWNMTPSVLAPGRGLLAWARVDEKDAVWVDAGTVAGAIRAVVDGRADLVQAPPTSPRVQEAAAAPKGIKYLNLDSSKDPEGAIRFQSVPGTTNYLWPFAPMLSGVPEAIGVWGAVGNMIQITHADTDVDFVYNLTKWLDQNYSLYKDKYATNIYMTLKQLMDTIEVSFVPVHDGTIKYLKEKGLWTPAHDARQKYNVDLMNRYVEAYPKAIALADQRGIKVDPTNYKWVELWTEYKIQNKLPKFVFHISLARAGPIIMTTEMPPPPSPAPSPAPTPSPAPAPALPPTKVEGDVKFELVSITSPVRGGDDVKIVANTEPGTAGTVRMWFADGQESGYTFRGRDRATANDAGRIEFNGTMFTHVVTGVAKVEIALSKDMRSGKATVYFEVK